MSVIKKNAVFVFLLVAGIYAATLNSWNAKYYGLQAATVAGLAERGRLDIIDNILPEFTAAEGDETFRFNGKIYSMKQPGQTILGAALYTPFMIAGIYFLNHYDYVVHIITFLTSTLMMASVAVMFYLSAWFVTKNQRKALATAAIFAFATILWPYAGVLHHDIYAAFFATASIFGYLAYLYKREEKWLLVLSGFLTGLTFFFSMLPITLPFGISYLVAARRKRAEIISYLTGLMSGLIPSLIFNYSQFGNILAFPNLAGKVADTIPLWSAGNFLDHLNYYLLSPTHSLFVYSPILLFGIIGILKMPDKYAEAKKLFILIPLLQLVHISTQATYGGYQYGPRYLLTVIPVVAFATVFSFDKLKAPGQLLFGAAALYSVITASAGALQTVMYPSDGVFGPWGSLMQIKAGIGPEFRFIPVGLILIVLSIAVKLYRSQRD